MDSVSQAALGAAVGVAVMGRERPVWQAALAGALVGTLPDLDVFIDKGDAVNNMVLHRAETHAFFWQLLASLPIAYLLTLITRSSGLFKRWWLMTLTGLFTHSMLHALTIYGTRLALPFSDPLYTLPLLLGLLATGLARSDSGYANVPWVQTWLRPVERNDKPRKTVSRARLSPMIAPANKNNVQKNNNPYTGESRFNFFCSRETLVPASINAIFIETCAADTFSKHPWKKSTR